MSGNTPIMENAFQDAISRFPNYYPLYTERLETLAPKWGGSPQAMVAFVERYADHAPENSPLRLLHVELYASLLNTAALACDAYRAEQLEQCIRAVMESMAGGDLMRQVDTALELYNKTDRYQFTVALQPLLSEIVRISGAGHFAGSLLESAASHMGTQLQLSENNAGHNNYMLDLTVANVWQNKRHYDNAEKKYREALVDVAAFPFPGEAERTWAMADIYRRMSGLYNHMAQYVKVIAYQDAAEAMGASGDGYKHLKCFAYYKLKHFEEAVRDCTKQLESGDDMQTRYWRAKSNLAAGRSSAALEDFNVVADSQDHHFRTSAAIDISVIYGNRKDMPSMLESLNRHAYLFDEKGQKKEDLAISYNNRCYAHMQLGRLQEALADCEVSLRYGNLPDAYQKYQELLKKVRPEPGKSNAQNDRAI
jgi:tetratricopeptide (TPR) repeat protein